MFWPAQERNSTAHQSDRQRLLHRLRAMMVAMTVALIGVSIAPEEADAKMNYTFEGTLKVQLSDGTKKPIPHAQIRVKRDNGTGFGRHKVMTNSSGRFKGTWKFDRDRNGILPGKKKIRFDVQVRLRNARLKIRKGGWLKNNWLTVENERGKQGKDFQLGDVVIGSGKKQKLAGLYWAHMKVLDELEDQNVGLTKKLTVIYPNKFIFKPNANFYLFKVRLTEDRWDVARQKNTETIIHEAMHQWDVNHMKGEANLVCVADAHHKPPSKWASSRCSGFMEGFAEATARQLNHRIFGADYYGGAGKSPIPQTMWNLRNGKNVSYKIKDLHDAQSTDDGWQNFLTFIMTEDKFKRFNSVPDKSCKPQTVPVWRMLHALKDEAPRKSNFFRGKATFSWFTKILKKQVDGFDDWDAKYYEMLGNPSNTISDIQQKMCNTLAVNEARVDEDWKSISASGGKRFDDPVVIVGPASFNGPHPGVTRVRYITSEGFDLRFQEWDYRERRHNDTNHTREEIPYMMLEKGRHKMTDGSILEVGTFELDGTKKWKRQSFDSTFPDRPQLFLTVQTYNGTQAVTVRARDVDKSGFEAALFEEEALNDGHNREVVGYMAIHQPGDGSTGRDFSPGAGSSELTYRAKTTKVDEDWEKLTGVKLMLDEEKSRDDEVKHVEEKADVLFIDGVVFAQAVTHNGDDTISLRQKDAPVRLKKIPRKATPEHIEPREFDLPESVGN